MVANIKPLVITYHNDNLKKRKKKIDLLLKENFDFCRCDKLWITKTTKQYRIYFCIKQYLYLSLKQIKSTLGPMAFKMFQFRSKIGCIFAQFENAHISRFFFHLLNQKSPKFFNVINLFERREQL